MVNRFPTSVPGPFGSFFNKRCWDNWMVTYKRMRLDPYLTQYTKFNSTWVEGLSGRVKSKTLGRKEKGKAPDSGFGDRFLDVAPKAHTTKENRERVITEVKKNSCASK